jgi:predicted Rdx family selenoprotein
VSFDSDLPTSLDRARALLGDTDEENELFDDDHYEAVLAQQASFDLAVAWLADELVALFAQEPDRVTLDDGTQAQWTERIGAWKALATRMRTTAAVATANMTVPVSIAVTTTAVW